MFIGYHFEPARDYIEKFARAQQVVGVRRPAEPLVADGKRLVDKRTAGRDGPDEGRQQRPVQVVRHDNALEDPVGEGPGSSFEIGPDDLQTGVAGHAGEAGGIAVDRDHGVPQPEQETHVAAGAAGEVQHRAAGGNQAGEAPHPGRGRPAAMRSSRGQLRFRHGSPTCNELVCAGVASIYHAVDARRPGPAGECHGPEMILFNLKCAKGHVFEGWFRDGAAFDAQAAAREIACPSCGSRKIAKAPMAPRIGKGASGEKERPAEKPAERKPIPAPHAMMQALRELRRHVEANCDYVGDQFPAEARRIHYGESDRRNIYGEATEEEARALDDEGIEFRRIPWVPRHDG